MASRNLRLIALWFPIFIICIKHVAPLSAQEEIPDSVVIQRLQIITKMLDDGKPSADRWWYGWFAGSMGATVAQVTVYLVNDDLVSYKDMAFGVASTAIGGFGQLITPNTSGRAPGKLDQIPDFTPAQRIEKLRFAEELLKSCAMSEKNGKSWKVHAANEVFNLGSGLIVWLGLKKSLRDGIINFGISTVFSEIQIWTQPTRAMTDYEMYKNNYGQIAYKSMSSKPKCYLMAYANGIAFRLTF